MPLLLHLLLCYMVWLSSCHLNSSWTINPHFIISTVGINLVLYKLVSDVDGGLLHSKLTLHLIKPRWNGKSCWWIAHFHNSITALSSVNILEYIRLSLDWLCVEIRPVYLIALLHLQETFLKCRLTMPWLLRRLRTVPVIWNLFLRSTFLHFHINFWDAELEWPGEWWALFG